jgi:hypothetical protein
MSGEMHLNHLVIPLDFLLHLLVLTMKKTLNLMLYGKET